MFDISLATIISIILNFILLILLFFKSALNEILKEWWRDKKRKKEEHVNRLKEFKIKFGIYNSTNLILMMLIGQKQLAVIRQREVDSFIEETFKSSSKISAELSNAIAEFIDFMPFELRDSFNSYEAKRLLIIHDILEGHITKEDILSYSEQMTSLGNKCAVLIDSELRKELD